MYSLDEIKKILSNRLKEFSIELKENYLKNFRTENSITNGTRKRGYGIGEKSLTTGIDNEASGKYSTAEGSSTEARGMSSHAEGSNTKAYSDYQHAGGTYNIPDNNGKFSHIVGNGTVNKASNSYTLDWAGNAEYAGSVKANGKVVDSNDLTTKDYVLDQIIYKYFPVVESEDGEIAKIYLSDLEEYTLYKMNLKNKNYVTIIIYNDRDHTNQTIFTSDKTINKHVFFMCEKDNNNHNFIIDSYVYNIKMDDELIIEISSNNYDNTGINNQINFLMQNKYDDISLDGVTLSLKANGMAKKSITLPTITAEELSKINEQFNTKANKDEIWTMTNMGQDVKEAMTGGSVAVVGENTILKENIVDKQIVYEKTDFLECGINLFDKSRIVYGQYLTSGTNTVSDERYIISDFIRVLPNTTYTSNFTNHIAFYNNNKEPVGNFLNAQKTFQTPNDCMYVRLDNNINLINIDLLMLVKGETLHKYTPYELKFTKNFRYREDIEEMLSNDYAKVEYINLFNKNDVIEGQYIDNNNKVVSNALFCVSNKIEILPDTTYTRKNGYHLCFYDENENFISGISTSQKIYTFTTPANAKYLVESVAIALKDENMIVKGQVLPTTYISHDVKILDENVYIKNDNILNSIISTSWKGKKLCSFGDSTVASNNWQPYLISKLGIIHTLRGIGSTTIAEKGSIAWVDEEGNYLGRPPATQPEGSVEISSSMVNDERISTIPTDTEVLLVLGGTNDFHQDVEIGGINDNETTFKGSIRILIEKLLTKNPNLKIFFLTPHQETHSLQTNSLGYTKYDYIKAIREVCDTLNIPVIDLWSKLCWNRINGNNFLSDGIHFNSLGSKRVSDVVFNSLITSQEY